MNLTLIREGLPFALEMLAVTLISMRWLNRRAHFWLRVAALAAALAAELVGYSMLFQDFNWIWFLLVFVTVALGDALCCELNWIDALYCAALAYATQHLASSLYILLVFRGSAPQWSDGLYLVVDALVFAGFAFFFAKRLPDKGKYGVSANTVLSITALVLFVALFLSMYCKMAVDATTLAGGEQGMVALFRGSLLFDILVCFFVLWSQLIQRREITASKALEKSRILWKQNERQYALSKENVELINRKCHDLRHQIAALSYAEGGSERRQAFVREVQDMLDVYDSKTDTGNEALNTILMEKGLYCKLHQIQWTCVADGSALAFMDVVDLYTLFGNAIDNAIESVEKIDDPDKRIISTAVWRKDSFAMIQIENYYEGEIALRDGLPLTSKGDTSNHGFGLKSMRKIAEKYNGTLSVRTEDHRFLLYVMLPLEEFYS